MDTLSNCLDLPGSGDAWAGAIRKFVTMKEDDYIHVEDWKGAEVAKQEAAVSRFRAIDRWGELLTIITIVAGLTLAVTYLYVALFRS